MDRFMQTWTMKRLERVADALRKNNMEAFVVADSAELIAQLKEMLPKNSSTALGGSMTLKETGVTDLIMSSDYRYIDRDGKDLATDEEKEARRREVFSADYFFTGTNAVTENGELYNVDGRGNRVAPMTFGPRNVIVIAGANKIVTDSDAALERVRSVAAPANNLRLETENPCTKTGTCMDCRSPKRICSFYVLTGYQMVKNRIKVFLLPQDFGY
jgi:hypothetical protein